MSENKNMNNKIVKNLMTSPAITCEYNQTIKEAIEIMKKRFSLSAVL